MAENIQRIFAGVETAFAGLHLAFVLKSLTDFELKTTTLHIFVEAFESRHDFFFIA